MVITMWFDFGIMMEEDNNAYSEEDWNELMAFEDMQAASNKVQAKMKIMRWHTKKDPIFI